MVVSTYYLLCRPRQRNLILDWVPLQGRGRGRGRGRRREKEDSQREGGREGGRGRGKGKEREREEGGGVRKVVAVMYCSSPVFSVALA